MKRKLCFASTLLFAATLLSRTAFPQPQAENPGILRVRYATIVVPNYDEALRWYTDVLGLEKVEEGAFGEGLRWIVVAPHGEKEFGIVLELAKPFSPKDPIRNYKDRVGKETRWVFEVKDCRRFYELLSKRGVKFPEPPVEQPWGVTEAHLRTSTATSSSSRATSSHQAERSPEREVFDLNDGGEKTTWRRRRAIIAVF